ncbi:Chromosome segregation ATPase [Yersinia rohdei ATCC 43380]|nr:Chromosome segregation ATPase [Yersinia rohdei ATCC 43380]
MLGDLQGRYSRLQSDVKKLKEFQQHIELLNARAEYDSQARETLSRLDAAFSHGFKQEKDKLMASVSQIKIDFKQLETQIKNVNTVENT